MTYELYDKVDELIKQVKELNERITNIEKAVFKKTNELAQHFTDIERNIDRKTNELVQKLTEQLNKNVGELNEKITDIERNIDRKTNELVQKLTEQLNKNVGELNEKITDIERNIEYQTKVYSKMLLNVAALQLVHVYVGLHADASIEVHRIGDFYLIVVERDDEVLLTFVADSVSDEVKKMIMDLKEMLEISLDKKVVHNVVTLKSLGVTMS